MSRGCFTTTAQNTPGIGREPSGREIFTLWRQRPKFEVSGNEIAYSSIRYIHAHCCADARPGAVRIRWWKWSYNSRTEISDDGRRGRAGRLAATSRSDQSK